jgi:hypothetical protein
LRYVLTFICFFGVQDIYKSTGELYGKSKGNQLDKAFNP